MSRESRGSRQQEEAAAERDGGRRVARSGAGELKGDVEIQSKKRIVWMKECKKTWKDWMAVKWSWWTTLANNATWQNQDPILEIEIGKHILVGFEHEKFNELVSLSKFAQGQRWATRNFMGRNEAGQMNIHLCELDAHIDRAVRDGSIPVINLIFRSSVQRDLKLTFVTAAFAQSLLRSVYG